MLHVILIDIHIGVTVRNFKDSCPRQWVNIFFLIISLACSLYICLSWILLQWRFRAGKLSKDEGLVNLISFEPQGQMGTSHHFGYEDMNSAYASWQLVRRNVTNKLLFKIFQRLTSMQSQGTHTPPKSNRGLPCFTNSHMDAFTFHCSIINIYHISFHNDIS